MNVGDAVKVWVPIYRGGYEAHGMIVRIFTTHLGHTCYEVELENMLDAIGNIHDVGWIETMEVQPIQ